MNSQFLGILNKSNCLSNNYDYTRPIPLAFNITHNQDEVNISFSSNLKKAVSEAGLGLSRFFLYVDECHFTCLSCSGPNEDQCLSCPSNINLIENQCKCQVNFYSYNHSCVSSCPDKYSTDTINRQCTLICPQENCQVCQDNLCLQCNSSYYLLKGVCTDKCPWYTTLNNGICIDEDFDNTQKPFLVAENMIDKIFNHAQLQSLGWKYKKYNKYNRQQINNLVSGECGGLSYAAGQNFLPFWDNCYEGCGLKNKYENLPIHYKVTIKYQIKCGDLWEDEPYYLIVDGQEVQKDNFTYITSNQSQIKCGSIFDTILIDQNLSNKYVSQTFYHTQNTLEIQLGYKLLKNQLDSWAGYREIQIYLHQCPNEYYLDYQSIKCIKCNKNCLTCDNGLECKTCVESVPERSGKQCTCPDGYYEDYQNIKCIKCNKFCLTCDNGLDCKTCVESVPERSGKQCTCPNGYYDDFQNNYCQICPIQFKLCQFNPVKNKVEPFICPNESDFIWQPL